MFLRLFLYLFRDPFNGAFSMDNLPDNAALIPVDRQTANSLNLVIRGDERSPQRVCTPIANPVDKLRFLSRCNSSEVTRGVDVTDMTIPMVKWCVHKVQMRGNVPGEILDRNRLVIESFTGELYSTLSSYCLDGLSLIVESIGPGPYDPPIEVHFEKTKTRHGQEVLLLVVGKGDK